VLCSCGARSALFSSANDDAGSGGSANGGTGGKGGTGGVQSDAGADVVVPPEDCRLDLVGKPQQILSFVEGNTDSPLMAVIDPGSNGQARLGFAAVSEDANGWHPELRVAELTVGPEWPDDTFISKQPVLYGFDAHAWGAMEPAADAPGDLALAFYHADEASPNVQPAFKFRSFDTSSWSPGNEIAIDPLGSTVYGFDSTPNGYIASWRATSVGATNTEPRGAILDPNGKTLIGPFALGPPEPYPGRAADVTWTGAAHLASISFVGCAISTVPCIERSVVIFRIDGGGGLSLVSSFQAEGESAPRRAMISSYAGSTWVVWTEAPLPAEGEPDDAPRIVRLARLDENGGTLSSPVTLGTEAHPYLSLTLEATPHGVLIAYPEIASPELQENVPGYGRMLLYNVSLDGELVQDPIAIETQAFANGPPASLVTIESPRSALLAWAARSPEKQLFVTYMARLDCSSK
jgi:hypothetical protein